MSWSILPFNKEWEVETVLLYAQAGAVYLAPVQEAESEEELQRSFAGRN